MVAAVLDHGVAGAPGSCREDGRALELGLSSDHHSIRSVNT